jgi:hypothetical protein
LWTAERARPNPHTVDRAAVERVKSFKFLCVHITDNPKLSLHSDSEVKKLPALQDIYCTLCHRKDKKITKDLSHLSHGLFTLLPSRWRPYRCNKAGTKRLINRLYLQAIRLLSSHL